MFHFLTDAADQSRYVELATGAVSPGGTSILGTFAEDGPTHCSGLPTARHSAESLADRFSVGFDLEVHFREGHQTRTGAEQPFTWVKLRRRWPA